MEMVANGSTLYSDTGSSDDLDAAARATELVGVRGMPGHFVADRAGEIDTWHKPVEGCLETLREQSERYPFRNGGKVRCAIGIAGMETASDRLLMEAKGLADERGLPMLMHQSWDEAEVSESLAAHGKRPIEHLADLGVLGPGLTLVHMIHLDEREVDLIVESGTRIVHCPSASLRRAKGAFRAGRIVEMLDRGVTVGLGSDGHSGRHDVMRQVYLTTCVHREVRNRIPVVSAQTALEMATRHGAAALAMAEEVGSLEPGKRADLVVHATDRVDSRPRFRDPVVNMAYHALGSTVDSVMVDGEFIYDRGRFTRFDGEGGAARDRRSVADHRGALRDPSTRCVALDRVMAASAKRRGNTDGEGYSIVERQRVAARLDDLIRRYGERCARSKALFEQAQRSMPGGNTAPASTSAPFRCTWSAGRARTSTTWTATSCSTS